MPRPAPARDEPPRPVLTLFSMPPAAPPRKRKPRDIARLYAEARAAEADPLERLLNPPGWEPLPGGSNPFGELFVR